MKRLILAVTCVATAVGALAGCGGSTKLTHVWSDPGFQTNSLQKLFVIGVAQNPGVRHSFEDVFTDALKEHGLSAVQSYTMTGDGQLDSSIVLSAVRQSGCDGVFITRLLDKKTVETYYPPTTTVVSSPYPSYYGGWYGYYSAGYAYTSSPGYTVQNEVLNIETNLYRVNDAKLVWSALSQSWLSDTATPGTEIRPFVEQLVYGLRDSKIVAKKK